MSKFHNILFDIIGNKKILLKYKLLLVPRSLKWFFFNFDYFLIYIIINIGFFNKEYFLYNLKWIDG